MEQTFCKLKWSIEDVDILNGETSRARQNDITDFLGILPWLLPGEANTYQEIPINFKYLNTEDGYGGGPNNIEVLVALTTVSGAVIGATITAIFQLARDYINRHNSREISLEIDGKKFSLKGHNLEETRELFETYFPEASFQSEDYLRLIDLRAETSLRYLGQTEDEAKHHEDGNLL